jgi:protein involved in polysaccharide export with SLBB domain
MGVMAMWETAFPVDETPLKSGDMVTIRDADVDTGMRVPPCVVSADGSVRIPLLGEFPVAGLTIREAEAAIADEFVKRGLAKAIRIVVRRYVEQ